MSTARSSTPRTFGLVGGLGLAAGLFYYREIVEAHSRLGLSARLLTVHADVHRVRSHIAARENQLLAEYLAGLLRQLASAGAELAAIPAFSPEVCAAELRAITPLPLLNIIDAIVREVQRRQLRRVSILGSRVTIETQLFGRLPDVAVVSPTREEIQLIDLIYARIVEEAAVSDRDRHQLRAVARRLIERGSWMPSFWPERTSPSPSIRITPIFPTSMAPESISMPSCAN